MFKIITDTACDFLMDYAASVDVTLIPLYITFDGETYYKDRTELSTDEFYRRITEEKIYPRTSLPSSIAFFTAAMLPSISPATFLIDAISLSSPEPLRIYLLSLYIRKPPNPYTPVAALNEPSNKLTT